MINTLIVEDQDSLLKQVQAALDDDTAADEILNKGLIKGIGYCW
jgi:hypothetical protein